MATEAAHQLLEEATNEEVDQNFRLHLYTTALAFVNAGLLVWVAQDTSSGSIWICLGAAVLIWVVEAWSCGEAFVKRRSAEPLEAWHNMCYKKAMFCLMVQTIVFFVAVLTRIFRVQGEIPNVIVVSDTFTAAAR